jgi:hypothetical protein
LSAEFACEENKAPNKANPKPHTVRLSIISSPKRYLATHDQQHSSK